MALIKVYTISESKTRTVRNHFRTDHPHFLKFFKRARSERHNLEQRLSRALENLAGSKVSDTPASSPEAG